MNKPASNPTLERAVIRVKELLGKQKKFSEAVYLAAREKGVDPGKLFEELRRRAAAAKKRQAAMRTSPPPRDWMSRLEDAQDRRVVQ